MGDIFVLLLCSYPTVRFHVSLGYTKKQESNSARILLMIKKKIIATNKAKHFCRLLGTNSGDGLFISLLSLQGSITQQTCRTDSYVHG